MYNLFNKFLSDSSALLLHLCVQLRQLHKLVETTQRFLQFNHWWFYSKEAVGEGEEGVGGAQPTLEGSRGMRLLENLGIFEWARSDLRPFSAVFA